MDVWLMIGYAIFVGLIAGCAALSAIFLRDEKQRKDAIIVLKIIWGTGTVSALGVLVMRLHEAGVLK